MRTLRDLNQFAKTKDMVVHREMFHDFPMIVVKSTCGAPIASFYTVREAIAWVKTSKKTGPETIALFKAATEGFKNPKRSSSGLSSVFSV
jgi:hypothetical protein